MAAVEIPLTSPYLSALYSSSTMAAATLSTTGMSASQTPGTLDWVHNVPPAITTLLVQLAPFLSYFRSTLEIVSWRSANPARSWLLLLSWLAICLGFEFGLKYLLPVLFIAPFVIPPEKIPFFRRFNPEPISDIAQGCSTQETLSRAMADVTLILPLLPFSSQTAEPVPSNAKPLWVQLSPNWPLSRILRVLSAIYIPYLILLRFIPKRLVVAILGTVFLSWRSPWAQITLRIVGNNGFVRYVIRRTLSYILGVPIEIPGRPKAIATLAKPQSKSSTDKDDMDEVQPPNTLSFRFVIHENQRWWLGVDWSAALLPNERPSWSSAAPDCLPLPPPATFTLPAPSSIVLPFPSSSPSRADSKGAGKKRKCIKRTATWHWAEPDWGVIVKTDANSKAERVSKSLALPASEANARLSEQLLAKGLKKVSTTSPTKMEYGSDVHGEGSSNASGSTSGNVMAHRKQSNSIALEKSEDIEQDLTDPDGWIYGGNKWEGAGNKGGMGKYTRHRRWTRLAVLTETVEKVDINVDDAASATSTTQTDNHETDKDKELTTPPDVDEDKSSTDHSLRKRLKAVVAKGAHPIHHHHGESGGRSETFATI
jgi:hypothetical protein